MTEDEGQAAPTGVEGVEKFRPLRSVAMGGAANGNTDVCCRAWHELGNSFMIISYGSYNSDETAFAPLTSLERAEYLACDERTDPKDLVEKVLAYQPDLIVSAGWNQPPAFRQVMKAMQPPVVRIMFMDSIWRSSRAQWVGRGVHRFMIDPNFDMVMVPGERTEFLARRLGFGPDDIIRGGYSGNTQLFGSGPRSGEELASRRRFLYVGRLIPDKGIDVLAKAYRQYRQISSEPWELHIAGIGPDQHLLEGIEGVTLHGFVQAHDLAALMHTSSGLVLPSFGEHFGIVVHEAAAAGLPLLVSETAGAVPVLIQDGYNGWAVPEGDVAAWSRYMAHLSSQAPDRLREMSDVSRALSTRLSPSGWARNLHETIERRRAQGNHGR